MIRKITSLVNLAQGVKAIPVSKGMTAERREHIGEEVIDMLLNGWRKRRSVFSQCRGEKK